jgi:glycosyltransferase involved in cell wall biosynthesis
MKIVSWQSVLTEHQYHTWIALQAMDEEIYFVLGNFESDIRKQQGWKNVDLSNLNTKVLPQKHWWKDGKEIIRQNPNALHVFGGFWADRRFFLLLLYAIKSGEKAVIMNEAYSEDSSGYLQERSKLVSWLKVQIRPILYWIAALILNYMSYLNQFCILAIGSQSKRQFTQAGFKEDSLFPFGYFVPKQKGGKRTFLKTSTSLRLIFVGNLLKIKGLDIAIKAVQAINVQSKSPAVILDIYGQGNPHDWLSIPSTEVTYKGVIPFGNAQSVIAKYDFLILPSRHDGWGVVVNEALLQGIPVIVSNHVGAKSLLETTNAGVVFKSGDQDDLQQVLHELKKNHSRRRTLRCSAENIAYKISPEAAAKYMKDVFRFFFFNQGERPKEIWRT